MKMEMLQIIYFLKSVKNLNQVIKCTGLQRRGKSHLVRCVIFVVECICGVHRENSTGLTTMLREFSFMLCYAVGNILLSWFDSTCPLTTQLPITLPAVLPVLHILLFSLLEHITPTIGKGFSLADSLILVC